MEKLGSARVLSCAANKSDDGSATVSTFRISGFDTRQVIAVREGGNRIRVFFADDLSEEERQRLVDAHVANAGDA